MASAIAYAHIELRDGVPFLSGTRIKVAHLALEQVAHGWDAAEIQQEHPELTLGQVHSALAYYHDHRDVIDRYLVAQQRAAAEAQRRHDDTPALRERLRARGAKRNGQFKPRSSPGTTRKCLVLSRTPRAG